MRVAMVQFAPWDKFYAFDYGSLAIKTGDWVVAETKDGLELGRVVELKESPPADQFTADNQPALDRVATAIDQQLFAADNGAERKREVLDYCQQLVNKFGLEMKLVDCYFSFDGGKLTVAFIAGGRVDFRDLVRELTRHFQTVVRLHQLGVRDEAKLVGDVGPCGQGLCCRGPLRKLGNVTSEFAENQKVAHRGSERLSGICGRLKCCLAYENDLYNELSGDLPAVGTRVKTKHGRGKIVGQNVLRGSVNVEIDQEKDSDRRLIVEVPIKK